MELSPPILNCEGLADALAWLRSQIQELHGLEVDLKADHAFLIGNADMRVLLFQIVRELLFNVVKHAHTEFCSVILQVVDDELIIEVSDQGEGFDSKILEIKGRSGFGLLSARERLRLFGGRLDTWSEPGQGTHATIRVPLQQVELKLDRK